MSVASYWATPKLRTDAWYKVPFANSTAAVFATVLDEQVFVPFIIGSRTRVKQIGLEVVTAQGAASTARVGLYANSGVDHPAPGKLVVEGTDTVDLNDAASKQATALVDPLDSSRAYVDLKQGLYWASFVAQTAAATATVQGDSFWTNPAGVVLPVDDDSATAFASVTTDQDGQVYTLASIDGALADVVAADLVLRSAASIPRFYLAIA